MCLLCCRSTSSGTRGGAGSSYSNPYDIEAMLEEFFHNPETKKKEEAELAKLKQVKHEEIIDYMIDDYEKGGVTQRMLDTSFNNLGSEVVDHIKSIPFSVLVDNYYHDRNLKQKYIEHLRNCGIAYLDAYKILHFITTQYVGL
jgi:hypothetical protein